MVASSSKSGRNQEGTRLVKQVKTAELRPGQQLNQAQQSTQQVRFLYYCKIVMLKVAIFYRQ